MLLGACLWVAAATMADEHHVDDAFGFFSFEDRREITERKVMIAKAVFDELVIANSQWRSYDFCPPPANIRYGP